MSLDTTPAPPIPRTATPHGGDPHVRVAVVGAGFSGLAAAVRLRQAGYDDLVVLERASEVGGTWRDNSYPGAGCDVMSLLYSFSFAPSATWSRTFGRRDEIFGYLKDVTDRFGLRSRIRFSTELTDATWDPDRSRWSLTTSTGSLTADLLVLATGYLSDPKLLDVPGVDTFGGPVFHTSRWDHEVDLEGKHVAVVGTGASAIQVVPAIADRVASLTLYQRTPAWVHHKPDVEISAAERWRRRHLPGYQRARRAFNQHGREVVAFLMARPARLRRTLQPQVLAHLHEHVPEGPLRDALTPGYTVGCKRLLFSDTYYPTLTRPDVELVPAGVDALGPGTVTAGGRTRDHDVVVLATGFEAVDRAAAHLVHAGGTSLSQTWRRSMSAYAGTTVAGFPNLVVMLGPNTALGHSSQTVMLEAQADYLVDTLRYMDAHGIAAVDVRPEAQAAYNRWLDARLSGTVWQDGGCTSWYQDASGRNPSTYPTYTWRFRRHLRRFRPEHHHLVTSPVTADALVTARSAR